MKRNASVQPVRVNITELLRSLLLAAKALRFRRSTWLATVAHSVPDNLVRLSCGESGGHSSFPITQITSVPADRFRAFLPFLLAERGYRMGWKRPSCRRLETAGAARFIAPLLPVPKRAPGPFGRNRSLSRTTHATAPGPPQPEAGLSRPGRAASARTMDRPAASSARPPCGCGLSSRSAVSWLGVAGCCRRGRGRFGEPRVQPCPDLLRCVGAAAPLVPCDYYPGSRHACEGCQAEYLPPAHLPRLRLCLACASAWMRPST